MKWKAYVCFSCLLCSIQGWSPTTRLQRDAVPNSYSLKLIPNIKNNTFIGEVIILVKVLRSMKNITLNSRYLHIIEVTIDQAYGTTLFKLDEKKDFLHIFYNNDDYVEPGEHVLNIKFSGTLNGYTGFYSINYRTHGTVNTMLVTKFSPIHAREAFPCFDEPYFRSIFSIRLVKPDNSWTALSNMENIGSFNVSEGIAVDFQNTVSMPTYLLVWILTDYTCDEIRYPVNDKKLTLRFFTSESRAKDRKEALKITWKALKFFENYTGIDYPFPKLDSIEVPFYKSKGMEHWGLVVYHENAVTYDPTSIRSQLYHSIDKTILIAHEVSHMWFGNLVTHEWYNDLWLTEGFARFMQYKAAFGIIGETFVKNLFQNNKLMSLFPLRCQINPGTETASYMRSLDDIVFKFGTSTYDQGAAILIMLEDVIGAEKLQQAFKKHLVDHQYKYATTGDFINTVQDVAPTINIRNLVETYLFQKKLPLIRVTEAEGCYVLTQEPLCSKGGKSIFGDKWTIPIKYVTSSNKTSRIVWFDKDMKNVTIPKSRNDRWIKINHFNSGLYRSLYSEKMYQALGDYLQELDIEDQSILVEETFLLAAHNKLFCDIPLRLIGAMRETKELNFLAFTYASRSYSLFMKTSKFEKDVVDILKLYFVHIFAQLYHKVSWNVDANESIDHRLLRIAVLESFCLYNLKYEECYKDAQNIKSSNITVHTDIDYIFNGVVRYMEINNSSLRMDTRVIFEIISELKTPTTEEKKCASWIKENLPQIIKNDIK